MESDSRLHQPLRNDRDTKVQFDNFERGYSLEFDVKPLFSFLVLFAKNLLLAQEYAVAVCVTHPAAATYTEFREPGPRV